MAEKEYLDYKGLQHVAQNVNARLKRVLELPATAPDGTVYLYVGATDSYTKGHIYQYSESEEVWADISPQGSGGTGWDVVTVMPSVPSQGQVVLYEGHSTTQYAHGGVYRYNNNQWEFLGALIQLVEVPFTLSLASVQAISGGDTARVLTFTASAESDPTEETIAGVTANGVIQGKFWNDLAGSISQVNGTTFRVTLDTGVTDSLGQLAQFPEGSFVTIPAFSWVSGTTQYIHASETISISETTVSQKLAFNTTGTLDSATQATRFNISSSYEIPFALTYSGLSTVAMKDSSYNQEVTQSWTPSIVAANDSTELIFTPSTPSALHGDNIAITAGTLTAVASGVTYTYSFSTDNLTLRWGNTSYNLGTYNNFASMTARPTSANSGSVTIELNPTGPGSTARELALMAQLVPTVTIDGTACANVTWTEGEIVASGAIGVSTVGGKTINVVWEASSASDADSYGIDCTANILALALTTECAYIEQVVVFSNPQIDFAAGDSYIGVQVTSDVILEQGTSIDYSEFSVTAKGVLQGLWITEEHGADPTISGTSVTFNKFYNLVDNLGQRAVFPSGSEINIDYFTVTTGDYKYSHAAQTLVFAESSIPDQQLDFDEVFDSLVHIPQAASGGQGVTYFPFKDGRVNQNTPAGRTNLQANSSWNYVNLRTTAAATLSATFYPYYSSLYNVRGFGCGTWSNYGEIYWGTNQNITLTFNGGVLQMNGVSYTKTGTMSVTWTPYATELAEEATFIAQVWENSDGDVRSSLRIKDTNLLTAQLSVSSFGPINMQGTSISVVDRGQSKSTDGKDTYFMLYDDVIFSPAPGTDDEAITATIRVNITASSSVLVENTGGFKIIQSLTAGGTLSGTYSRE